MFGKTLPRVEFFIRYDLIFCAEDKNFDLQISMLMAQKIIQILNQILLMVLF